MTRDEMEKEMNRLLPCLSCLNYHQTNDWMTLMTAIAMDYLTTAKKEKEKTLVNQASSGVTEEAVE